MTYKLFKNVQGEVIGVRKTVWEKTDSKTGEKTWLKIDIPVDEDNTDYQEYLKWAKTNTAEAAD